MTAPAQKPKRRFAGLLAPWFIALAALGGYSLYWFQVANAVEERARAALGGDSAVSVSGWPFRLTLKAAPVSIGTPGSVRLAARELSASAVPFSPALWVLEGARDVRILRPDGTQQALVPDGLEASIRFAPDGLGRLSLMFKSLAVEGDGGWRAGAGALHLIADPSVTGQLALSFDLAGVKLPAAPEGAGAILGDTIARIRLAGPVEQGQILLRSPSSWAAARGAIAVMDARLEWGPASFSGGAGKLWLDSSGLWNGELAGTGALRPNGLDVPGLAAPLSVQIDQGEVRLLGFKAATLPGMTP